MSDIYRPLYVMVEAVEAECQRLLAPPPPPRCRFTMQQLEESLSRIFSTNIVCTRMAGEPVIAIGHHCKFCNKKHFVKVPEYAGRGSDAELVRQIVEATGKMLESACNIELGTRL